MKKIFKIIAAAIVSTAFIGAAASAQTQTIIISGTGPDSNNVIEINDVTNVTYTCDNNVITFTYNDQNGQTGNSTVDFNTNAGAAISGAVSNTNITAANIDTVCAAAAPTPTSSPSPSVTPVTPGQGSVTPTTPKSLPNTASNSLLQIAVVSLLVAAAVVAGSRLVVATYRHFGSK